MQHIRHIKKTKTTLKTHEHASMGALRNHEHASMGALRNHEHDRFYTKAYIRASPGRGTPLRSRQVQNRRACPPMTQFPIAMFDLIKTIHTEFCDVLRKLQPKMMSGIAD